MNNLQQLILLILQKQGSSYGYEITKQLKELTGNSHQQIYHNLNKLLVANVVKVTVIPQEGKPDLKLYSLAVPQSDNLHPILIPSDFAKNNGVYSLASYDIINGTSLTQEYLAAAKKLEQTFLSKMNN